MTGAAGLESGALRRALIDRAEALFRDSWGDPANSRARLWRPRRPRRGDDPRRMTMMGPARGLWFDSARDLGGDLFDLIAVERLALPNARADFPRVLRAAARWLGTTPAPLSPRRARGADRDPPAEPELSDLLARILPALTPLAGGALAYWTEARGLDPPPPSLAMRLPGGALAGLRDRRFPRPEREAVVILGRDAAGDVRAMQRILLAPRGIGRDPDLPKFSLGPIGRYPSFFPARAGDAAGGALILAEGPESAGALWSAAGSRVLVCAGSMAGRVRSLPRLSRVILALEADAPDSPAATAMARAMSAARLRGARLAPLSCGGAPGSGFDPADLIRAEGGRADLRRRVAKAAERLARA